MTEINNVYLHLYNKVSNRLKEYNLTIPFNYESLIKESQSGRDCVDVLSLLNLDREEFVKACYSQLLGRECSLDEINLYNAHLRKNSIREKGLIIHYFINSDEYLNDPVPLKNNVIDRILMSPPPSFIQKVLGKIKNLLSVKGK